MLSLSSFCSCWWWDVPDLAALPYWIDFAWWKRKKKAESLKRLEYNKHCFFSVLLDHMELALCMKKKAAQSFVLPLPFLLCKASPIQQPRQASLISSRSKNTVVKVSWSVVLQGSRWQKGQRWWGDGGRSCSVPVVIRVGELPSAWILSHDHGVLKWP